MGGVVIAAVVVGLAVAVSLFRRRKTANLLRLTNNIKHCPFDAALPNVFRVQLENKHSDTKGLISACLFLASGSDPKTFESRYLQPFIKLAAAAPFLPGWHFRVYVPVNFPDTYKKMLREQTDCEIATVKTQNNGYEATLWRYLPLLEDKPFLCIDADLERVPISKTAVNKWLGSSQAFIQLMLPHNYLLWPMTACLFGCHPQRLPVEIKQNSYTQLAHFSAQCTCFGCDEVFLTKYVHPLTQSYGVKHVLLSPAALWGGTLLVVIAVLLLLRRSKKAD